MSTELIGIEEKKPISKQKYHKKSEIVNQSTSADENAKNSPLKVQPQSERYLQHSTPSQTKYTQTVMDMKIKH